MPTTPYTDAQLDNWFTYHAPTEETAPKYAAIRAAADGLSAAAVKSMRGMALGGPLDYTSCTDAARNFVRVIGENCPDSADKTAAVRCVRLARNAFNEAVSDENLSMRATERLADLMAVQIYAARWQACSAIACDGK